MEITFTIDELLEFYFKNKGDDITDTYDFDVKSVNNFNSNETWKCGGRAEVVVGIKKVIDA